ncbi:hypothetical protein SGRIM119S_04035 [Streptomyces griseorubiginosus]
MQGAVVREVLGPQAVVRNPGGGIEQPGDLGLGAGFGAVGRHVPPAEAGGGGDQDGGGGGAGQSQGAGQGIGDDGALVRDDT